MGYILNEEISCFETIFITIHPALFGHVTEQWHYVCIPCNFCCLLGQISLEKYFFFLNVSDTFYLEPPGKPITSSILWRLFFSPAQNELVSFLTDRYAWHIIYPSSGYEVTKISPLLLGHLILTITPSQHLLTGNSFHQLFIHLLSTVYVGIAYILHIYM